MLTEKYAPKKHSEIIGQEEAVKNLLSCIKNDKHALVIGASGTGKTSSFFAIARELNYEVIELNSSNFRSKRKIDEIVGNSVRQKSLFSRKKIVMIDELEGLSGQKDRGCLSEVEKLIDESVFPIILISNKLDRKLSRLKKRCNLVKFSRPDYKLILSYLKEICKKERIDADNAFLANIAYSCNGDIRAAINDVNALYLGDRERASTMQDSLKIIFKSKSASSALNAFDNLPEDLDECLLWLEENIPKEYSGKSLYNAYEYLSKADIFRKRILKNQYYGFLRYVNFFLTGGISSSKEIINEKNNYYNQSSRILKMWIAKQRNLKRVELAKELALKSHCSKKKIMSEMPYLNL